MTDRDETKGGEHLLDYVRAARVGRHHRVSGEELEHGMRLLRAWQSARLARTHADLLADPRYGPACEFFLTDVYAPRDFSQRDHDITRVYESMHSVMPRALSRVLEMTIALNELTKELDETLLDVLVDELGVKDEITEEQYAEGYRRSDTYDLRVRQIELILELGREIDRLVHKPAVGLALRLAGIPARLAGWHEMQDFIERGFAAFKHMKNAEPFLETITGRERRILDRIYEGVEDPFDVSEN